MQSRPQDVLLPLEELQAIGERYSPHVLRQYFQSSTGASAGGIASPTQIEGISIEKLNVFRKSLLLNVPSLWIGCLGGALAFGAQPEWTGLTNPITYESTINSIHPNRLSAIFFLYGLLASVVGELICVYSLRNRCTVFEIVFFGLGGLLNRVAYIFDAITFVVFVKAAPQLALVGAPMWFLGACLLLVQLRMYCALLRSNDHFSVVAEERWIHTSRVPTDAGPENPIILSKVTEACSVFDYNLLYSVLTKRCVPIFMQADLVVASSCKAHFSCLNYHLLLFPVKVFFLADYGNNVFVFLSIFFGIFSSLLNCVANTVSLTPTVASIV